LLDYGTMTAPNDALDAGNHCFHEAYGAARTGIAHQVPILVLLPEELVLHHQDRRWTRPYSRPSFVQAKSAAHIAVALFALTCAESDPEQRNAGVARLLEHIAGALDLPPRSPGDPLGDEIRSLLKRCQAFAEAACRQAPAPLLRAEFASDAGPRILQITDLATREQVVGLHEAVEAMLSTLSSAEQAELQVVVVGDHQARTRSLGMQYFKRRFNEQPGIDRCVTYGENITDEAEAISLVATRRLDKRIAQAFFGDETRLQRDVLGDAAQRCIDQIRFLSDTR
jgi:hypothetical protein